MRAPVSRRRPSSSPRRRASRRRCAGRQTRPGGRARARPGASHRSRPEPTLDSPLAPGPDSQLEPAELLGGQGWRRVGVVLLAAEQGPEQAGELARRGDDRDLVAAAGADPLVEGPDRTRPADRRPARLDQGVAGTHRVPLRDPPASRRARARLADPGVEPEVADQVARALEAADVAAAMNVAAQTTLTPGTVMRRLISAEARASVAIGRSTAAISESRNSTWRSAESTASRSSSGRASSMSQRRPLTPNGSANGGRPTRQRIRPRGSRPLSGCGP